MAQRSSPPTQELLGFEALGVHWRTALDAADTALRVAAPSFPEDEVRARVRQLAGERNAVAKLLDALVVDERTHLGSFNFEASLWLSERHSGCG